MTGWITKNVLDGNIFPENTRMICKMFMSSRVGAGSGQKDERKVLVWL